MAIKIKFDNEYNVQTPVFVLATRNGTKLGSIPAENIVFKDALNSYSELSFSVHKEIDGVKCKIWDDLVDFKLVWCKEWNLWFEAYVEIDESNETVKNVELVSLGEAELSQVYLYDIQINTEDDIARDDYKPTVLYDSLDKSASLLDRISEKVPHYTYKHIDSSLSSIQRTFSFDNKTIYDAFMDISKEINCIFIIECSTGSDGKLKREISVYDLESYCVDCGHRGDFIDTCPKCSSNNILEGYGEDTSVFVSVDNLADNITYSTDNQSVKNCFKLSAGDDLMTATLVNCNPNGSGYIWYFSDSMKRDMSGSEYTGENLLINTGLNFEKTNPDGNNVTINFHNMSTDESVPSQKCNTILYTANSKSSHCGVKYYRNTLINSTSIFEIDKPYVFSFYAKCSAAKDFNEERILKFGSSDNVVVNRYDLPTLTDTWQRFEVVFTPKSSITEFMFRPYAQMEIGEQVEISLSSAKLEMGTVATSWEPNLVSKLISYDKQYQYYQNSYTMTLSSTEVMKYNQIVNRYLPYTSDTIPTLPSRIVGYPELMNIYYNTIDLSMLLEHRLMPDYATLPDTNATAELRKLDNNLSPVSILSLSSASEPTVTSTIQMMARIYIDPRYQIKVSDASLSSITGSGTSAYRRWTGKFTITNYSDEEDTATSSNVVTIRVNDNYEGYLRQRIQRVLDGKVDNTAGIVALFEASDTEFKNEIKKYCLNSLKIFYDACDACLNVLIEQGAANENSWNQNNKGSTTFTDAYNMYLSYRNKSIWLSNEIKTRNNDILFIKGTYDSHGGLVTSGIQDVLETYISDIQDALNLQEFIGEESWNELAAYRRETPYSNDNYISEGLDNAELFKKGLEFIENATKEIYRSANLQHSISATLHNLLVMREFSPIVDYISVGNWIRVKIDDEVYKLRLISYEMSYGSPDNLSVTFSDVKKTSDGISDVESILNQASSMASSYGAITRQASQGHKSNSQLSDWVNDGLSLTNMKIVGDADNQNIEWDANGMICREYIPEVDEYDDRQLKIINKGLYVTDDGWETAKAGIGNFIFYNPETRQVEEAYGVIADTLVGNLILSKDVGIYNPEGSISLNKDGFNMIIDTSVEEAERQTFKIQTSDGENEPKDIIYFDSEGNANFEGNISATSLHIGTSDGGGETTYKNVSQYVGDIVGSAISDLGVGNFKVYYQSYIPQNPSENDIWYNISNSTITDGNNSYTAHTIWKYNGTSWDDITSDSLYSALEAAESAKSIADSKVNVYAKSQDPSSMEGVKLDNGDLWINTNNNEIKYWDGQWNLISSNLDYFQEQIDNLSNKYIEVGSTINETYVNAKNYADGILNNYKDSVGKYMDFDEEDGLVIGAQDSTFRTVIDDSAMRFQESGATIAYISNQQLNIQSAIIHDTLFLGKYLFAPHSNNDGGFSIVWGNS